MNVLVTGASSGIGEALALALARRGDTLFLCARNAERLAAVAERCRAAGAAAVHAETVDVAEAQAVEDWVGRCDALAPLELVFANAGVSTGLETDENVRRTFAINVGGVVNTVLSALRCLRRRPGTARYVVITASIAGYGPLQACPAYSATKSCVKTWGLALAGALKGEGIGVSVVCPGFVRSRITDGNTCPMPFFLEADVAAAKILAGVAKGRRLIAFPWPMRLCSWFMGMLPERVNAFLNRRLPKKVI